VSLAARLAPKRCESALEVYADDYRTLMAAHAQRLGTFHMATGGRRLAPYMKRLAREAADAGATHFILADSQSFEHTSAVPSVAYTAGTSSAVGGHASGSSYTIQTPSVKTEHRTLYHFLALAVPDSRVLPEFMRCPPVDP
jgi:hypothetical protein